MSELDDRSTTWFGKGGWFGYNYLGPGTDVRHHKWYDVQPVDALDKYAQKHDFDYNQIMNDVRAGKLTYDEAYDLVDKADAALGWGATKETWKGVPGLAWDTAKLSAPPGADTAMGVGENLYKGDFKKIGVGYALKKAGVPPVVFKAMNAASAASKYGKIWPKAATGAAMHGKYLLSKLGIARGSFSGLDRPSPYEKYVHGLRVESRREAEKNAREWNDRNIKFKDKSTLEREEREYKKKHGIRW